MIHVGFLLFKSGGYISKIHFAWTCSHSVNVFFDWIGFDFVLCLATGRVPANEDPIENNNDEINSHDATGPRCSKDRYIPAENQPIRHLVVL